MVLQFKRTSTEEFKSVYQDMLKQFPQSELKDYQAYLNLIKSGNYDIILAHNDNIPAGYAIIFKSDKYLLLDYLAVAGMYHGKGFGGEILNSLKKMYPDKAGCFLEVEKPNPVDNNTYRRISFYQRHGAEKINIDYYYPNREGDLAMDLYYIAYKSEIPSQENILNFIKELFGTIHQDIPHIEQVLAKIG